MLTTIIAFSTIMWYLIDRAKLVWVDWAYGRYLTMGLAAALGFGLTFAFNLDLIFGLALSDAMSIPGQVLTGFSLMAGSSAVSEIIALVKTKGDEIELKNYVETEGD